MSEDNSDIINSGSGDDLVVGDTLVVRAPLITITAGATPPVKSKDDWSEPEKWNNKGFRSAWWKDWNWNGKDLRQLDRIIVSVDTIDGGSGNDLVWGDTVALLNSTVRPGAGVDDKAKFYKDAKKYIDDGQDALTAVKAETERFLSYSKHGHDHKNYWRNVTWGRSADLAWFNANPRDTDGGDTILGGDGNDVIFGQEGLDRINGGLGNDWLIGGSGGWNNKDVLTGGGGTDKLFQGDNDSKELRAAVQAAMPNWSSAFVKVSLPVVPFGANTELVKGHKEVDVDLLGFTASPWGVNNLMAAQAPGTLNLSAPPSAATVAALVAQAKQYWLATGLADANMLDGIQVKLADLGGKDRLTAGPDARQRHHTG